MKPIQVGLMGFGVVGSGVFNVLQRNQAEIQRRAGREIVVKSVSRRDVALDLGLVALQDVEHTAADNTKAHQAHLNRFHALWRLR